MKIRQYFLELRLKISGMFFETQCSLPFAVRRHVLYEFPVYG